MFDGQVEDPTAGLLHRAWDLSPESRLSTILNLGEAVESEIRQGHHQVTGWNRAIDQALT